MIPSLKHCALYLLSALAVLAAAANTPPADLPFSVGELGGVFEKSEDASLWIWMAREPHAYPLLIESEVIVGSFWARLHAY